MDAIVSLTAAALTPLSLARDVAAVGRRHGEGVVTTALQTLAETADTLRAARTVLLHVAEALEAGLVDDLVAAMEDVSRSVTLVERVSAQVDQALDQALPVLDSASPTLTLMNSTLAQLEVTLAQLQAMPGVRMAKRLVGRPAQRGPGTEIEQAAPERLF